MRKTKQTGSKRHYVVCGYGLIGRAVCQDLRHKGQKAVVVEKSAQAAAQAEADGFRCVGGSAHDERTLKKAGVCEAAGVVTVLGSDADNVFAVLTLRGMGASIPIVAGVESEDNVAKLRKVGATSVVSAYQLGGERISCLLTNRVFADFLDSASLSDAMEMVEVVVRGGGRLAGKSLQEVRFREAAGALVLSVTRGDGRRTFSPVAETMLATNDRLLCVGEHGVAERLSQLLGDSVLVLT